MYFKKWPARQYPIRNRIKTERTTVKNISEIFSKTDKRTALIGKNILFSFLLKGWSALVIFLLVPFTLKCLGEYKNGVWLTISSLLVWIDQLDIGLGNGLRNNLAACMAENNIGKAREMVSSTLAMLVMIVVPVMLLLCLLIHVSDVYAFINVNAGIISDLDAILTVSTVLVCVTFIAKFVGNFYLGLQLPAVNNLLVVCGQSLALAGTVALYYSGSHSLFLIAVANTFPPLVVYAACYYYTFFHKYPHLRPSFRFVKMDTARSLFSFGIQFFILQLAGGVLFLSSNVLISHLFSPETVTPYQITYRYFSVMLLVFTIICTPFWTATTDAYKKNDMAWIKKSNRMLNRMLALIFAGIAGMTAVSRMFYDIWIGPEVSIPWSMTVMMALFMTVTISSLRYSYILNGLGALRLQLITTLFAAAAFIPLSVWVAGTTHSMVAFMGVMCVVNVPGLAVNMIQYHKILRNKAFGIWMK